MLINARSICNKLTEFNALLNTFKPSFVAICETWLSSENICDSFLDPDNNYTIFRQDRKTRGGGVCLLIDKMFRCIPVSVELDLLGVELLCVDIVTHDGLTRLAVCYRSTSLARASLEANFRLIHCLNKLLTVKHSCILLGDFNLPGIDWFSDFATTDPIQQAFFENFCSIGLEQLNSFATRNDAILDLVLSNDPELISDLLTLPPLGASDHDIVSFSIFLAPKYHPTSQPLLIRSYTKCNYDLLSADLQGIDWIATFDNCLTADDFWVTFLHVLDSLLEVHCPLFTPNFTNKKIHYPIAIRRLQTRRKRVWRRLGADRNNELLRAKYRSISELYKQAVNDFHFKRESDVLNSHDSSKFHNFIRRKLKRSEPIPVLLDDTGIHVDDGDVKANMLNNFFSSIFTLDDGCLPPFPDRLNSSVSHLNTVLFTPVSVQTKLARLKKSTTLNPDTFPPIVLRCCSHQLSYPLSVIFNATFYLSELPSPWLTSTVIPLFKKGQRNLVSNYRPISLTSTCCKVMESIIHDSLSNHLLSNNLISEHQHGFLKKRSTVTNLLSSLHHWVSSLNSRKSTDVIYVDFAKAFDSVSHPKLLHKLSSYGISGKLYHWISSWLSGRTQRVKFGNFFSLPKHVLSGVLQGSVLGPLLFLVFINDLVDNISQDAHPTLFADDLKLFSDESVVPLFSSPNSFYSPLLQDSLNNLYAWANLWQLTISIPKCSILCISNSKSPNPRLYTIDSNILPQVTSYSDLGVLIDDKLSFSGHILSVAKKAYRQSALITRCFLSKNISLLKRAFITYVRPLLEYASQIWSPHLQKDITILEKVQRRFTKNISNLHSLPYSTRLARLKLPLLSRRRIELDLCLVYRIIHCHTILEPPTFFNLRVNSVTRGHPYMLHKPLVRLNSSKFAFCARVIDAWNSLPLAVVSANMLPSFKRKLRLTPIENTVYSVYY